MKINIDRSSLLAAIARVRPFTRKLNGIRPVRLVNLSDSPRAFGFVNLETGSLAGDDGTWKAYAGVETCGVAEPWEPVTFDLDALEAAVGLGTGLKVNVSHDGNRAEVDGFALASCRVAWRDLRPVALNIKGNAHVHAETFGKMLGAVIPFATKEETRYAIRGIHVETDDGSVRATATDGRRLGSMLADAAVIAPGGGFTLPVAVAKPLALRAVFSVADGVTMLWDQNRMDIRLAGSMHETSWGITVLSDGSFFPDWRQVIPKDNGNVAKVSATELGGAMKGLKPLLPKGKDAFRAVRFAGVGAALSLAVLRGQSGSEEHPVPFNVPVQSVVGNFDVRLNADYVADVAKAMKGKDIRIAMKDDCAPVLFRTVDDDRFVAVVMPIASA